MIVECIICHKSFKSLGMLSHVNAKHKMNYKNDYRELVLKHLVDSNIASDIIHDYENYFNTTELSLKYKISCKIVKDLLEKFNKIRVKNNKILELESNNLSIDIANKIEIMFCNELMSTKEISYALNIKEDIIRNVISLKNISFKDTYKRRTNAKSMTSNENIKKNYSNELIDEIIKRYTNEKQSCRSIERTLNINRNVIVKILLLNNVHVRGPKEAKQCSQKHFSNNCLSEHPHNVRVFRYHDINYQGTYEIMFVLWLNFHNIKFEAHNNNMKIHYIDSSNNCHNYFPDFLIISDNNYFETGTYIEVKELFVEQDRLKIDLVKKFNLNIKHKILLFEDLKKLGVFEIEKVMNVNIYDFYIDKYCNNIMLEFYKNFTIEQFLIDYLEKSLSCKKMIEKFKLYNSDVLFRILEKFHIPKKLDDNFYEFYFNYVNDKFKNEVLESYKTMRSIEKVSKKFNFLYIRSIYDIITNTHCCLDKSLKS